MTEAIGAQPAQNRQEIVDEIATRHGISADQPHRLHYRMIRLALLDAVSAGEAAASAEAVAYINILGERVDILAAEAAEAASLRSQLDLALSANAEMPRRASLLGVDLDVDVLTEKPVAAAKKVSWD